MTHLIIHHDLQTRNAYLINFLNTTLEQEYASIASLHNIPDFHILEKPEGQQIGIDDVKILIKEMIYHPYELKYQVAIIFHSHNLTTEAQNALLKNLEEQSDNTLYILLVDNEKHLLDTIVSRCTRHYVNVSRSAESVKQTNQTSNDNTSSKTSKKDGNDHNQERNEIGNFFKKDLLEKFQQIEDLEDSEKENPGAINNFINELENYFLQKLEQEIQNNDKTEETKAKLDHIIKASQRLHTNANKRLILENLALQISEA